MKKKNLVLMLTAMMLVGGTTTYAASSKTVQATVANFKYTVNGFNFAPSNSTKPVTINGQTYIPASVVKEALKTNVTVDAKSGKINFGEKLAETPIMNEKIDYAYRSALVKDSKYTTASSADYKEVILLKETAYARVSFFPNNKYQTLVLNLITLDNDAKIVVKDEKTKEKLKTVIINKADGVSQLEIDVTGKTEVSIESQEVLDPFQDTDVVIFPNSYYK